MLDNPEKTARLVAALKTVVPFEVELTPEVVKQLQAGNIATPIRRTAPSRTCIMPVTKAASCSISSRRTNNKHSLSPSLMFECPVRWRSQRPLSTIRSIE